MRATATPLENHRVSLAVEVDEAEMDEALDQAAKRLAARVSIKGFRKGKVPRSVLVAHLGGPAALRAEALQDALPDFYARAVADTLVDPIAQPEIAITAGQQEGPLAFTAEVEVRPEIDLVGYRELRVTIPSPQVSDDEVDAQVDRFRETDAVLHDVDRPVVTGDLVVMDLHVEQIATGAEPLDLTDYMYPVGSGTITEGVDELILGLKAGETLKVNGSLDRGVVATFTLNLKQVKERELPELTDEWVEENTEWASVGEMRDAILQRMRRVRLAEAQLARRDAVLVALSHLVPEDAVPEALVASETEERLHDLGHRLEDQKLSIETFLSVTNQSSEQLLETLQRDAVRAVRVDLALRGLVRAEGLEATPEEIDEELTRTGESRGVSADRLRANLRDTGRVVAFAAEVAKIKASRWLNDRVTFVDPDGVEIDRSLLEADPRDVEVNAADA
jgi:trigger factor